MLGTGDLDFFDEFNEGEERTYDLGIIHEKEEEDIEASGSKKEDSPP